jgi:hypothetical protein
VRVECTKTDMLVTLAFGYPFNGRVYVNGNYQVTNKVQRIEEKKIKYISIPKVVFRDG